MIKRKTLLIMLVVSFIVLASLSGGVGCRGEQFESHSLVTVVLKVVYGHVKYLGEQIGWRGGKSESDSLIATARETVYAQMKWLEEQKFEGPGPPAPVEVNVDSVESKTTRIGIAGGNGGGDGGGGGGGGWW